MKKLIRVKIILLSIFFTSIGSAQTTFDWLDTAPDGNWRQGASGARWNPGGLFDQPGFGILRFNNNHQLTMTNNVAGTYGMHQIIFGSSNTTSRTITGSGIVRLFDNSGADPKIENLSSGNHVISFNLLGDGDAGDPLEINPVSGNLTFNNTIGNQGSNILIFGNNGFTARFNNIISGAGAFIVRQNSKVIFNNNNIYSGNTELENGELWIETVGNAIDNNNIFVGNASQLSNVTKFFLSRITGGSTFSRDITVNTGNSSTRFVGGLNTSGVNEFSGSITNNATQLNLEVSNSGGTVRYSNIISGSGGILKIGAGIAEFSGTSKTYTGVTRINAGTLQLLASNQIANSSNIILAGGNFSSGATTGNTDQVGTLELLVNSSLALATGTHTITFANSSSVTWAGTTLTITGWSGTAGQAGSAGRVFFGNSAAGLITAQLDKINFTGFPNGAQLLSSGELVPRCANPSSGGAIAGSQSICAGGDPVAFTNTINAAGQTGTLEYKWQQSITSSTTGFADVSGATANVYDAPAGITQTTWYKRLARVSCQADWTAAPESNVLEVTIASTTWTSTSGGSWTNGTPTATTAATIEHDFTSSANFVACSLTVSNSANVVITSGNVMTLNNSLIVNTGCTFTLNSDAVLLQGGTSNTNTGDITVKRNTQDLMRLDYTLWSSPVGAQNLGSFSPLTTATRFYTYTTATNIYTAIANTNDFTVGEGYLIRTPDTHPTSPTAWEGNFIGTPNSGDITFGLSTAGTGFNAVGNPYPSPINIATFLADNTSVIAGNLYFWRKTNAATGSAYVTFNGSTFSSGPQTNNTIQPGQGFIVEATAASDLSFNNLQRVADNGVFFRNANTTQADDNSRIWLNLLANNEVVGQMAVGYRADATNEIDALDANYINDSALALNSFVANTELAVQHRATFEPTDVVALSFKANTAGNFTIAINAVDGLFDMASQTIFLKDNILNTEHDLRSAPYSFTTEVGTFTNRFQIVYQSTLSVSNPNFENGAIVYSKNKTIEINTGTETIATVRVIDIRGSIVSELKAVNTNTLSIPLTQVANQVLIIQITGTNGQTISKKVVH